MEATHTKYILVFNLKKSQLIGLQPEVWLAPVNESGNFNLVSQRAFAHTLKDFGLNLDSNLEKVFLLINELQEQHIERHFNGNANKKRTLSQLKGDNELTTLIEKFIEKRLDQFLSIVCLLNSPITLNIDRSGIIDSHLINYNESEPEISLHFNKKREGIYYKLKLISNNKALQLLNKDLVVITNTSGWVIIDKSIFKLNTINSNMLKPFITKEEIFIPEKLSHEYFKSFILKINNSVNLTSEGFELIQINRITKVSIELVEDFFNSSYFLKLVFYYGNEKFDYNSDLLIKQKLTIDESNNINIHKYIRDSFNENKICLTLKDIGLSLTSNKHFVLSNDIKESNNLKDFINFLRSNKSIFETQNINITNPFFFNKEISLSSFKESVKINYENDWFDIYGIVTVGEIEFPFVSLLKYIKTNDNFFPLSDGKWFIIPDSWMARYQTISKMGEEYKDGFRLLKSQAALIEELENPDLRFAKQSTLIENNNIKVPVSLNASLRPYQIEGFKWLANLYEQSLGACLADDMGLGKTLQAITLILYIQSKLSSPYKIIEQGQLDLFSPQKTKELCILIVLPASLVFNWKNELLKFAPQLNVYCHVGSLRYQNSNLISNFEIILTTYNIILRDSEILKKITFNCIILDESQQIKNKDSKLFNAVSALDSPFRLTLSGTPIENSLSDLWSQMQFINPGILGSFSHFKKNFKEDIEKYNDGYLMEELKKIVQPYILRRTKKAVAPDLPNLTEQIHYCEMNEKQAEIYEMEKSAARNQILLQLEHGTEKSSYIILNIIQRLRQIACHPGLLKEYKDIPSEKFEEVLSHFKILFASNQKALVYSSYLQHLEFYKSWLTKNGINYSCFTGENNITERNNAVQKFKEEDCPLFLLSLKAGGVGLNLTEASYVFLLDPWWNPAIENQAIARAHRIGQQQKVTAIRFISLNTIEEKIIKLQERKLQLANNIIEDWSYLNNLSDEDLLSLVD